MSFKYFTMNSIAKLIALVVVLNVTVPSILGLKCELSILIAMGDAETGSKQATNINASQLFTTGNGKLSEYVKKAVIPGSLSNIAGENIGTQDVTYECPEVDGTVASCGKLTYEASASGIDVRFTVKDCVLHTGNLTADCRSQTLQEFYEYPATLLISTYIFGDIGEAVGYNTKGSVCTCNTDACNSAGIIGNNFIVLSFVALSLLMYFRVKPL